MAKRKIEKALDAYWGLLPAEKLAEGMTLARANAKRLWRDAKLLLDAGRFATAAAISVLAIEEAGRIPILRELALAESEEEAKECWQQARSHRSKSAHWIAPSLVQKGATKLDEFRTMYSEASDHTKLIDGMKQLGFYADCLGKGFWNDPVGSVPEKIARELVKIAEFCAKGSRVSTREVELWIEHMGPCKNAPLIEKKRALFTFQKALVAEGLSKQKIETVATFLGLASDD